MQPAQGLTGALRERRKEAAQGGLTRHRFDAQHLGHGGVALQPRDPRELIGPDQNPPEIAQRDVGGRKRIGTGGRVRQQAIKLLTELLLPQKVTPDNHPPMSGEPLIGEPDSDGR